MTILRDISTISSPLGDKVTALLPEIAERAAETEKARRLPADLAAKLADAGVFNMIKPASCGGLELDPFDIVEVLKVISAADASTGWCAMIGSTTALNAAYLAVEEANTIYSDPLMITGGVFAPMARAEDCGDHYLVSGRWQWGSGSANCGWLCGGAMIFEEGELKRFDNGAPYHRMMIFPVDQAELIDTWHVSGLKGTGSGDIEVKDIKVPKGRTVSLIADTPVAPGPLYVFPVFGLLALGVCSVALGNAAAALEDVKQLVLTKKSAGASKSHAERTTVQAGIARMEAKLGAADAYLREVVTECWQSAKEDGALTPLARAKLRNACTYATEISAEIAKSAHEMAGGTAVFESHPLQRRFRDAHVATQHIATAWPTYELAGRILLDLPTDTAML
jgi:alkylation response protein AidB-like acyl-CoA dehydrogenase